MSVPKYWSSRILSILLLERATFRTQGKTTWNAAWSTRKTDTFFAMQNREPVVRRKQVASRKILWWRWTVSATDRWIVEKRFSSSSTFYLSLSTCSRLSLGYVSGKVTMTREGWLFCARLLTHVWECRSWHGRERLPCFVGSGKVSNLEQLFRGWLSDHCAWVE